MTCPPQISDGDRRPRKCFPAFWTHKYLEQIVIERTYLFYPPTYATTAASTAAAYLISTPHSVFLLFYRFCNLYLLKISIKYYNCSNNYDCRCNQNQRLCIPLVTYIRHPINNSHTLNRWEQYRNENRHFLNKHPLDTLSKTSCVEENLTT